MNTLLPARRHEISRLEAFSDAVFAFALNLVSAGVGLLAVAVALFAFRPWPQFSGFVYVLMGPMHWIYGVTVGRSRRAFEATIANGAHIGVTERAS